MRALLPIALCLSLSAGLGVGSAAAAPVGMPAGMPAGSYLGHSITRSVRTLVHGYNPLSLKSPLPEGADRYRYVLVKGLIGNAYPRYMARSLEALRRQGLEVEFAPVDTGASVAHNSAIIEQMIKTSDKPIVFIAHSKGVADTTDAIGRLAKSTPGLVQTKVRGLVSLEGAYRGSPVADALAGTKWGMRAMKGLAFLVRGSVDAGLDLRTAVRRAAVEDHPMPTHLVPTVAFVGYKLTLGSLMAPGIYFLRKGFGLKSDGLVAHRDAVIEGGDVARMQLDHAAGAFGKVSDRLTLALVSHVLAQPQLTGE